MIDIEELKIALQWDNIYEGADCPVICFDSTNYGQLSGNIGVLGETEGMPSNFYIKIPEYQTELLSFQVTNTRYNTIHQYWVLGSNMHRVTGPAFIYTPNSMNVVTYRWYYNGVVHRDDGPAESVIRKLQTTNTLPNTGESIPDGYTCSRWSHRVDKWYTHGSPNTFPNINRMETVNGYQVFKQMDGKSVPCDLGDTPSMRADSMTASWLNQKGSTEFMISRLVASDYTCHFGSDGPHNHSCSKIRHLHAHNHSGSLEKTDHGDLETIRTDLFPEWEIWGKPLFKNEQELTLAAGVITK